MRSPDQPAPVVELFVDRRARTGRSGCPVGLSGRVVRSGRPRATGSLQLVVIVTSTPAGWIELPWSSGAAFHLPILVVVTALVWSACGAAGTPAGDVPSEPAETTESTELAETSESTETTESTESSATAGTTEPTTVPTAVVTTVPDEPDDSDEPDLDVGVPSEELAAVLAAVAPHRVTVDNSFGGGAPFERVEVVEAIGETGPDGMIDARHDRRTA